MQLAEVNQWKHIYKWLGFRVNQVKKVAIANPYKPSQKDYIQYKL